MTPMPQPRWPFAVAAALLLLGLLGFSGSSVTHGARKSLLFDGRAGEEPRESFGTSRGIRTDEWSIDLPTARSQQIAEPSFPLVNLHQGLGQLQRNVTDSPVLDWGLAFRPLLWPLLVGTPWSQGVRWFLRSALLLLGLWALLRTVLAREGLDGEQRRQREAIAALSALAIAFSSAFTWWLSSGLPETVLFASFAVAAAGRALREQRRVPRLLWHGATAWLSASAFFIFYPPIWPPLLLVLCAALVDLHWRDRTSPAAALRAALPSVVLVACGAALSIAYFAPFLALVIQTLYPAHRVAAAGGLPPGRLLDMVWPSLRIYAPFTDPSVVLGSEKLNECEASAVEALPFFLCSALAAVSPRVRAAARRAIGKSPASFTAWGLLAAWLLVPMPAWFGWLTLLRLSPWNRAWFVFGLSTALLSAALVAELTDPALPPARRTKEIVAAAAFLCGCLALAVAVVPGSQLELAVDRWNHFAPCVLAAGAALAGAALLETRWGPRLLALAWAVPLVLADVGVHPLVASNELFARGSGHAQVDRALASEPGRLLDYTTHIANSLAGYGWPVLSAVQFAPDVGMFRFLAPDSPGLREEVFNRYALVHFRPPPGLAESPSDDSVWLFVSPCSQRLAALGVNHFLAYPGDRLPPECADRFVARPSAELQIWSRKDPVCAFGVARGPAPVSDALRYDYSCAAGGSAARLRPGRSGLTVELPADSGVQFALALNLSLVDRVSCQSATARLGEAHLFFAPTGPSGASCRVEFLGTAGGLRRLLSRTAPVPVAPLAAAR
jgi:hypothetical protein